MGVVVSTPIRFNSAYSGWTKRLENEEFEKLLTISIQKRAPKWCRLCMSETCCHDNKVVVSTHTPLTTLHNPDENTNANMKLPDSDDDTDSEYFSQRLKRLKQKRKKIETFLSQTSDDNDTLYQRVGHTSYFGTEQREIPVSLLSAFGKAGIIVLSLVPTFPTSEQCQHELHGHIDDIQEMHSNVLKEYSSASKHRHQLRLTVTSPNNPVVKDELNVIIDKTSVVSVFEEVLPLVSVRQCTTVVNSQLQTSWVCKNTSNTQNVDDKSGASMNTSHNQIHDNRNDNVGSIRQYKTYQQLHNGANKWTAAFECHKTTLLDNGHGRVEIKGSFHSDNSSNSLPFQVIIFLDQSTPGVPLVLSGTYSRKMETAQFRLKWKFRGEHKI